MLAHYLVANVGYKVAPHRFQIAGWWPLIFHPKACCLQSGPYKVALINHNACTVAVSCGEHLHCIENCTKIPRLFRIAVIL